MRNSTANDKSRVVGRIEGVLGEGGREGGRHGKSQAGESEGKSGREGGREGGVSPEGKESALTLIVKGLRLGAKEVVVAVGSDGRTLSSLKAGHDR